VERERWTVVFYYVPPSIFKEAPNKMRSTKSSNGMPA
jgi:hypothetical protein